MESFYMHGFSIIDSLGFTYSLKSGISYAEDYIL